MIKRLGLLVAFLAASPVSAETQRVTVAGAKVALTVPAGHCLLERGHAADRHVLQAVERVLAKTNRLLAMFADCAERDAFRARSQRTLANFGQYLTPLRENRTKLKPAAFAQQMTGFLKSKGAEVLRGAEADTRERLASLKLGIGIGETRTLGVLRTDERASYFGFVQNLKLADGTSDLQVGVTAAGAIKGRIVTLNLYSRFTEGPIGAETTMKLLEKAAQTFGETARANGQ
jgi:hypothetical protein